MPIKEYQLLMLSKIDQLYEFMEPENQKRWFRSGNPELTSSLIKSQINMIRNSIGGVSQK
jgi:hypothetical protein